MAWYQVHVQWSDGTPCSGARVALGCWMGVTDPVYTDSSGKAAVQLDASPATLYVDGQDYGTVRPGNCVATKKSGWW